MKVFLSWSGEQSKTYANALRDWLPLVIHFAEPWVSDADIEAGERWATEVGKELETSNFGIICINRENIGSQWLLFEAGALSRSMQEGRVIPLLFDIEFKDISGPLAQFQAKKFDVKGLWDVVCAINRFGDAPIPDARLKQLFDALWSDLDKEVEAIPKAVRTVKASRPQHEVLEELVSSVRGLDTRLREASDLGSVSRQRRDRYNSLAHREMMHMMNPDMGSSPRLLILASSYKDQLPWLYDMIAELYRLDIAGNKEKSEKVRRQIVDAVRMISTTRIGNDKSTYELMGEIEYAMRKEDHYNSESLRPTRNSTEDPPDAEEIPDYNGVVPA